MNDDHLNNYLKVCNTRLEEDPNDLRMLYTKGCFLLALDEKAEAYEYFQMVMHFVDTDEKGQDMNQIRSLAECGFAECLLAANQNAEAEKIFKDIIRKNPQEVDAYTGLGCCYGSSGKYLEAIEEFKRARDLDPNDTCVLNKLARCYYYCGNDCIRENKFQDAIDDYTRALDIESENVLYYCKRGTTYRILNNKEKARKDFEKAIELYDKDEVDHRIDLDMWADYTQHQIVFIDKKN